MDVDGEDLNTWFSPMADGPSLRHEILPTDMEAAISTPSPELEDGTVPITEKAGHLTDNANEHTHGGGYLF